MDRPSYRDARTHLKRGSKKEGKKGKRKREKEKGREKKPKFVSLAEARTWAEGCLKK